MYVCIFTINSEEVNKYFRAH